MLEIFKRKISILFLKIFASVQLKINNDLTPLTIREPNVLKWKMFFVGDTDVLLITHITRTHNVIKAYGLSRSALINSLFQYLQSKRSEKNSKNPFSVKKKKKYVFHSTKTV